MGDDVNDLDAMKLAGLAATPADAHPAAKSCAAFVASRAGGHGAVREFIDAVLAAKAADV
jgi:3-deoxy-D-manno-octulosonate 8-phosphate phosphatase (KDO 8-P phosphatase)